MYSVVGNRQERVLEKEVHDLHLDHTPVIQVFIIQDRQTLMDNFHFWSTLTVTINLNISTKDGYWENTYNDLVRMT